MNYTFQSFNFRYRQGARPFYDLIANIAAEEYGHIELVAATINTRLPARAATATARRPTLRSRASSATPNGILIALAVERIRASLAGSGRLSHGRRPLERDWLPHRACVCGKAAATPALPRLASQQPGLQAIGA
jgi:Manganese containing catalase